MDRLPLWGVLSLTARGITATGRARLTETGIRSQLRRSLNSDPRAGVGTSDRPLQSCNHNRLAVLAGCISAAPQTASRDRHFALRVRRCRCRLRTCCRRGLGCRSIRRAHRTGSHRQHHTGGRVGQVTLLAFSTVNVSPTVRLDWNAAATVVTQLTGDPDWGAGVTLAQAEIAYRRRNYDAARSYVQTVTPVFTRKDAEPLQKRAFESLKAALDKPQPRK